MGTLTPKTVEQQGISRSALYRGVQEGRYQRIARGIYIPVEAAAADWDWDWLEAATRRTDATISLTSALAYYELTDVIPTALDIAIPRGARIPAGSTSIAWHSFDRDTFNIGRHQVPIPGTDMVIGIYSPERSITDAFRLRGDLGYDLGRDALKAWLRQGGKPAQLIEIASRLPRAKRPILQALEYLA